MTTQPGLHLPVTGAFALPFAAYYIILTARVVVQRSKQRVAIGDHMPPSPPSTSTSTSASSPVSSTNITTPSGIHTSADPLLLSTRCQQNFAEFVPLALLLATIAEANNAVTPRALKTALGILLAARVLHVEAGILRPGAMGLGRPMGFYSTLGVIGWLGWAVGRGFWGL
ncbi:membrane-associated, eicosanoid/glutathione metabolism protein [Rostrohypoxylon terebratum]|nr:membrane-associated, eicosanoid/glutathione metabolism protein [Rostrohypoxylon terebratum]